MNVLVTGASGFVGRNLLLGSPASWRVHALYRTASDFPDFVERHRLAHVEPVHCDLTSPAAVEALRGRLPERFDAVVHLAANGDPAYSVQDPLGDLRAGPGSLVSLLTVVSAGRLVYFSSGAVYDGLKGPVGPDTPVSPTLPYAIGKVTAEQYVKFFRKAGRIDSYVILRFFGGYGPWEPARKIYTRLARWAMAGTDEPFEVRGDGRNLIDAMYVDDVVRGIRQVLASAVADAVVDFVAGSPLTIDELVETAARMLGRRPASIRHVSAVAEYIEFFASPERMERLFGFRCQTPLDEGLRRLHRHLREMERV